MENMIVEGVLFKGRDTFLGIFKDWKNKKEIKVVCKPYSENKYNVFVEDNGKLKLIGRMFSVEREKVRCDKEYDQVAVIKLFNDDYTYSVLECKSKDGKTYYKVL